MPDTPAPTPEELATAFSRHDFEAVAPHLADDAVWVNHGGPRFAGRDTILAACRESATHLASVRTTFRHFRTVVTDATVVVDSVAEYAEPDGTSVVASCDLYDVQDGRLTAITSYTVGLPEGTG